MKIGMCPRIQDDRFLRALVRVAYRSFAQAAGPVADEVQVFWSLIGDDRDPVLCLTVQDVHSCSEAYFRIEDFRDLTYVAHRCEGLWESLLLYGPRSSDCLDSVRL